MSSLGGIYRDQGDYLEARKYFTQAIAIDKKVYGAEHPEVASTLNGLAITYHLAGDDAQAVPLFEQALAMKEKFLGAEHPEVATSLNNLALAYQEQKRLPEAEALMLRALRINEKVYGAEHPEVATVLLNLSTLANDMNAPARAETYAQRALGINEKRLGPQHPSVAVALNNLAAIYDVQQRYDLSEPLYRRALAIYERAYGPNHPDTATFWQNIATGYLARRDVASALPPLTRGNDIRERTLNSLLSSSSEAQKRAYLTHLDAETSATVSLNVNYAPRDATAARLALTTILRRKGRALDAMADQIGALRRRANPQDQALLDQLADVRARLAQGPGRSTTPAETARLNAEAEQLELEISRRSAEFRALAQPVTLDAVQRALPPATALVEYFVYQPFTASAPPGKRLGLARYVAYVLRPGAAAPEFVELGDAATLESEISALRAALQDPKRGDVKELARRVDERVWRPARRLAGPAQQIFLSPDGALNLLPFAALVDENGRYAVENYTLSYLSSGRDLLRLQIPGGASNAPVVIANPQFDKVTAAPPAATSGTAQRRSLDFASYDYEPLPGTGAEASALQKLLPDAQVLTQERATEAALKNVAAPRVLHIATHGFFLDAQTMAATSDTTRQRGVGLASAPVKGENPLLRSGLILAGVKQQASGAGEDGVLTALEAAGLNLWGTKLVILSACETGLGDVKNGDGVYGLRRALVLAGSETQIMSLWQVSDTATRDLMIGYYSLLKNGTGRAVALRQVQLAMLRGTSATSGGGAGRSMGVGVAVGNARTRQHPYYWAAFIPSGAWTPLK